MFDDRAPTNRRKRAEGRRLVSLSVALAALITASFTAFLPVLEGASWWLGCAVVALVVNAAAAATRAAGGSRLLGSLTGTGVGALSLTALCGGGTALAGLIPTPTTISHFVELSQSAGQSIYQQSIPAQADEGITFLLIFASLMASVSVDLMAAAAGAAAPAGLVALAIVVPPAVLMEEVPLVAFALTALAYLAVLWADRERERQRGGLMRMLAVGVVAASVASVGAAAAPGFSGANPFSVAKQGSLATRVSPLLHLGEDLQRDGNSVQFRYRSTSEDPPRFRMMTLESFDGDTWGSTRERSGLVTVESGAGLERDDRADVPTGPLARTAVSIEGLRDRLLPIPDGAVEVRGAEGTWLWDPFDETMRSRTASTTGLDYTVSSIPTLPTAEQLRAADLPDRGIFSAERELPNEIPGIITETLDSIVGDIDNPYESAYAIQNYLRDGGFMYSLSAPVSQGYDGDSLDVIATFLERKAGYCVHFAATMATMARMIDIPSRIVVGFLPGSAEGDDVRVVRTEDLHAWPELYFEGAGWVAFEPTPGRGGTPSYAPEVTSTAEAAGPNDMDPRTIERSSVPTETATPEAEAASPESRTSTRSDSASAALVFLALVVLLAVPAGARQLRRGLRLRAARARPDRVSAVWAEISDTATDLGWQHPVSETPRMLRERIRDRIAADPAAVASLDRLVFAVERARYGPRHGAPSARFDADARLVIAALRRAAGMSDRLRAVLWPASLFARRVQPTVNRAR
ncbi:transglutaminaseTgpA domain-containing protein [Paramicrobacterium agarici]|uniref:Uncharacterized protein DUF4129 n=1 Tax=Paramicrobacterium agarici TaxID=630514 RepID=A0A2A9DZZ4_9MICO|nr:DUF3488 and transglutaminase-like domain-containing protein [Microbacterium agarici]PFG31542.1 uncharacterized protein DUF4129 [Microbacterium agarici]